MSAQGRPNDTLVSFLPDSSVEKLISAVLFARRNE